MSEKRHKPYIPPWLDDSQLPPTQFRILAHLWRRAGLTGECWPSARSIAKACKINRDSVWPAIAALEEKGLLSRKKTFRNSNRYTLTVGGNGGPTDSGNEGPSPGGNEGPTAGGNGGPQRFPTEDEFNDDSPRNDIGNEDAFAPVGVNPTGSKAKKASAPPSEGETKQFAACIIAKEGTDPESAIAAFPPEEVIQWALDWFFENEATGWILKGSPMANPKAALARYLRKVAGTRTKRFKELAGATWEDDE